MACSTDNKRLLLIQTRIFQAEKAEIEVSVKVPENKPFRAEHPVKKFAFLSKYC